MLSNSSTHNVPLDCYFFGTVPYVLAMRAMRTYVTFAENHAVWVLEHPSVYSFGRRQVAPVTLPYGDIPSVYSDRGGLTSYHGPGQVIFYCLFNLPRLRLGIKEYVYLLEQSVIDMLYACDVVARRVKSQPGVYIGDQKIASLGLKITKGWSYHGIACNYNADLTPFCAIDPCGQSGLQMVNLVDCVSAVTKKHMITLWLDALFRLFGFTVYSVKHTSIESLCAMSEPIDRHDDGYLT